VVGDLMDKHDLFVMRCLFEGFGIVLAEALIGGSRASPVRRAQQLRHA